MKDRKHNTIVIGVVIALLCAGGGFYGGMHYAQTKISSNSAQGIGGNAGRTGANGVRGARFAGGGAVFGTIIAKDAVSITVKLMSMGSSTPSGTGTKIVLYDTSTQVGKFTTGSANDLSAGEMITANGTSNSDGSVTASQIQIRPAGTNFRGQ